MHELNKNGVCEVFIEIGPYLNTFLSTFLFFFVLGRLHPSRRTGASAPGPYCFGIETQASWVKYVIFWGGCYLTNLPLAKSNIWQLSLNAIELFAKSFENI